MDVPLELNFINLDPSEALEVRARERAERLDSMYNHLVSCRVYVEAPPREPRKDNLFNVRIEMSVPGDTIMVSHQPHHLRERYQDPDAHKILDDAFDVAERRLKRFKERQRGDIKRHKDPKPVAGPSGPEF